MFFASERPICSVLSTFDLNKLVLRNVHDKLLSYTYNVKESVKVDSNVIIIINTLF